ncbi:hypothetical protein IU469_30015 [Nocardia puris]|uniref:hypothetical protein n=1 Tax=Nocardia puris TaxID=208602 RepID=UPI001895684C|nr:hypothetical protein [Nocardia puris]MBF6369916.1 hypothetical protein [Nocardia puris]
MVSNRIVLDPLDPSVSDREIVIGWDRGLGTYFAQVLDGVDESGDGGTIQLSIGTRPDEIGTADEVIEAVRPFAIIPDTLHRDLVAQHEAPGAQQKSPFLYLFLGAALETSAADGEQPSHISHQSAPADEIAAVPNSESETPRWETDPANALDSAQQPPEQGYGR